MSKFLLDLPNELIFQILLYVSPSSTPTLQLVCRKFNDLTQPLLWKYHCRTQFRYWNAEHCIQEKFSDNAAEINWKKVFSDRHTIDKTADYVLNSILSSQLGRIEKSERIVKFGYDTKDTLLRNIFVENDSEDVLARRLVHSGPTKK